MSDAPHPEQPPGARRVRASDRTRVGRYRLAYELASGGMATVYLARVEGTVAFDKIVALKRIHRHLIDEPRYVTMFLDEARIASRIDHPNVASVIDFGEDDGDYYLVMEFLLGVPLSRLIATLARTHRLPERWPAIASRLVADACEGLHAAHELRDGRGELFGVVHRDVSPQNLFVGFDGILRVVDFGVAQAAGKLHQTVSGEIKGKIAYMSPEQLKGTELDRRADVWGLGVVLWEMLTFRRLFKRATEVDAMYGVLESEVPAPSQIVSGLPVDLDAVILRALDRRLDERWPTARALGRRLGEIWGPVLDRPVDAVEVAQLLAETFPGEEERQRALVELARQDPEGIPVVALNPSEESFSGIRVEPQPIAPPRSQRASRIAAAVFAVVGLAAGAAVALLAIPDAPAPTVAETRSPAAPPELAEPEASAEEPVEPAEDRAQEQPEDEPPDEAEDERAPTPAAPVEPRPDRPPVRPRVPTIPDPPETAAPTGPGHLVVVVPGGWAHVYHSDGRHLGTTPLRLEVPPGMHRVQLRFFGEPPPVDAEILVEPGGVGRISRRAPER